MTRLQLIVVITLALLLLLSFSSNPPQGRTGGPGERTCASAGCHVSQNASIQGRLELRGLPQTFERGVDYNLSLDMIVVRGTPERAGLQMIALTSSEVNADAFSNPGVSSTVSMTAGRSYFEHDPAKRFDESDTVTYDVTWNYTGDSDDDIIFYAAANFANGNGANSGDRIVLLTDTFQVAPTTDFNVTVDVSNPTCLGTDGAIQLDVMGGTPPYSFEWFADSFILSSDSTDSYSGLPSGSYIYSVLDNEGLTISGEVILQEEDITPPVLSCLVDTVTINTCTPLSYPIPTAEDECSPVSITRIAGLGSNQSFPAGITLEVYEASDTSANIAQCTIVINNIIDMMANIDVINIACHDDSTGSVVIDASGGTEPYTFSTLSENQNIDSLTEGRHTIIITDATGCQIQEEVEIRRPQPIFIDIVEVLQPLSTISGDGAIDIDANGGAPPYAYQWRTEDEDFSNDEDLTLLFPGTYYLIVTDSRGCMMTSDSITLDALTFIADIELSEDIDVYPNPTDQRLYVDIGIGIDISSINIIDITGRVVQSTEVIESFLDVSRLTSGVFMVAVQTNQGKIGIKTFVKL